MIKLVEIERVSETKFLGMIIDNKKLKKIEFSEDFFFHRRFITP